MEMENGQNSKMSYSLQWSLHFFHLLEMLSEPKLWPSVFILFFKIFLMIEEVIISEFMYFFLF